MATESGDNVPATDAKAGALQRDGTRFSPSTYAARRVAAPLSAPVGVCGDLYVLRLQVSSPALFESTRTKAVRPAEAAAKRKCRIVELVDPYPVRAVVYLTIEVIESHGVILTCIAGGGYLKRICVRTRTAPEKISAVKTGHLLAGSCRCRCLLPIRLNLCDWGRFRRRLDRWRRVRRLRERGSGHGPGEGCHHAGGGHDCDGDSS